jgi:hypothetical protein
MATLEQRIITLEKLAPVKPNKWKRIVLAGESATAGEQDQIDSWQRMNFNVIIRSIIQGGEYGNA